MSASKEFQMNTNRKGMYIDNRFPKRINEFNYLLKVQNSQVEGTKVCRQKELKIVSDKNS
jgi:hypothetical protein